MDGTGWVRRSNFVGAGGALEERRHKVTVKAPERVRDNGVQESKGSSA